MYPAGHAYDLMFPTELETIHRQTLRILSAMGMEIQNRQLLEVPNIIDRARLALVDR